VVKRDSASIACPTLPLQVMIAIRFPGQFVLQITRGIAIFNYGFDFAQAIAG